MLPVSSQTLKAGGLGKERGRNKEVTHLSRPAVWQQNDSGVFKDACKEEKRGERRRLILFWLCEESSQAVEASAIIKHSKDSE